MLKFLELEKKELEQKLMCIILIFIFYVIKVDMLKIKNFIN